MTKTESLHIEFSKFAGELAESLSFSKSVGQIYGLLYISSDPLSLDDICQILSTSKGNVSINLRILKGWGAIRSVWIKGSRRDHYEANHNLKEIGLRRLQEGLGRRLDMAKDTLNRMISTADGVEGETVGPHMQKKIKELQSFISTGQKALQMLPKVAGFFSSKL